MVGQTGNLGADNRGNSPNAITVGECYCGPFDMVEAICKQVILCRI